jgi:AhpD family alkylhydroperoxidase
MYVRHNPCNAKGFEGGYVMKPETFLSRVPREQLDISMQAAFDRSIAMHEDATFVEVMGHAPAVYDWYQNEFYKKLFYGSALPISLLELVRLRLANLHGCAFCNRNNTAAALLAGIKQSQIDALPNFENGPFSASEKAALALADEMALTNPKGRIDGPLHARLTPHFTDGQLVELGVIMAVLCGMAKMIFAFDLVEKEASCPFLP